MTSPARFFGKHRGTVIDNLDPLMTGRVLVSVPSVTGAVLNWALPCVPYPAPTAGCLIVPPISAYVWVEFEAGDLNLPIWSGCFWALGEPPLLPAPDQTTNS